MASLFWTPRSFRYARPTRWLQVRALNTEPLIGSKEVIERKRLEFEAKYKSLLEKAAKEKGLDVEQLKQQAALKRLATASAPSTPKDQAKSGSAEKLQQVQAGSLQKEAVVNSAVKPLSSILDIQKLLQRTPPITAQELSALWTAYHASSKSQTKLGAVVPLQTYHKMYALSRQFPEFILPLPREGEDGTKGAEMIFLQWAALPPTPGVSVQPSSVLFTSLAAYKAHGTYAQPALCITHYTDLADTHGLVLLRGEITSSESSGSPLMPPTDAQLLLLRLQQFYASEEDTEHREFLSSFHGKGKGPFDVEKLAGKAWDLT